MKSSKYNFALELDDGALLLYNCASGAIVKMLKKDYEKYFKHTDDILTEDEECGTKSENITGLKKGHFIVDDDFDELNYIKALHNKERYSPGTFQLGIVPSGKCNFACNYCFYKDHGDGNMLPEVEKQLLETVRIAFKNRRKLNVTWTGGEPTLAADTIIRLSRGFIDIAKSNKAAYASSILTNGYLLDRKMASDFAKCGIQVAQIALDGPAEVHNARRPLKNGEGTFDVILNNIREISDLINVILRINIDRTNACEEYIEKILDQVEEAGVPKKVFIDIEQVVPYTLACSNYVKINGIKHCGEYADVLTDFIPLVTARGYNFMFNGKFLMPALGACPACSPDCLQIAPNGDIYKCIINIGDSKESLGNIMQPSQISNRVTKWVTWDPFERVECRECKVLPLCMGGGCPFPDASLDGSIRNKNRCSIYKSKMKEFLKIYYDEYMVRQYGTEKV